MNKYSEIDLINPKDVVQVHKNIWCWCIGGNPKKGGLFIKIMLSQVIEIKE